MTNNQTDSLLGFLEARKAQIDEISEGNADALGRSAGLSEAIAIARQCEISDNEGKSALPSQQLDKPIWEQISEHSEKNPQIFESLPSDLSENLDQYIYRE